MKQIFSILSIIIFLLLITSCNIIVQSDLSINKQKWIDHSINHYKYDYRYLCFSFNDDVGDTLEIEVENNTVKSIYNKSTNEYIDQYNNNDYPTISDLFGIIQNAINSNSYNIDITYDPNYSYPTSILIDGSMFIIDDEISRYATNLIQL
jgi:hypothetical protein